MSKQKQLGREILKSKTVFPDFNLIDYDSSLRINLQYYNLHVDNKIKKSSALSYWKNQNKDVSKVSKLNDSWFSTCGAVAHMMIERQIELVDKHLLYMDNKFSTLCLMHDEDSNEEIEKPSDEKLKLQKEEKQQESINNHISELEYGVDVVNRGGKFDPKSYLLKNQVKPYESKQIAEWFKQFHLKEIKLIDSDVQLKEAYSHFDKRELKRYKDVVELIIASCEVATAIQKAARKPRAKKIKDPEILVKNVKYLKLFNELNLSSINPSKIVDSNEIWLFDTKARRLFKYIALQTMKLSIRGTTLLNFDASKSGGKILRKPDIQLKGVELFTSRPLNKLYNDIRASQSKPTGRINENCIILKAF